MGQEAQRRREVEADRKADAERRRAEEQYRREEAEGKPRADEEEHRRLPWSTQRSALLLGCLTAVVAVCAIGAWFALSPAPTPVAPARQAANAPLAAAQERALKPRDTFQECRNCPVMMVVPAGRFMMGSPAGEPGRFSNEDPQHEITIASQFAVGQYELRFDEWDACVADGGCNGYKPPDQGWGRKDRPVINVSWGDAHAYVSWLAKKTGKPYRLLTEAEYEYAARAGTQTPYPWGDAIGENDANCTGCGSQWSGKETAPVGSFAASGFGLYDVLGNVWEWTQDCYHNSYNDAPTDGSAWTSGVDCYFRVLRGGSWINTPKGLRSALRDWFASDSRAPLFGFRVARTLLAP
jgi:formylglycine-generating enzyme required for sulfatase activity